MDRRLIPLNSLRAFEATGLHLSFTRAAVELNVTQSAVSAQVKSLEDRLGTPLFRRLPRGLALTDEGQALLPMLADTFHRIGAVLDQFRGGRLCEVLTVAAGARGTATMSAAKNPSKYNTRSRMTSRNTLDAITIVRCRFTTSSIGQRFTT